MNGADLHGYGLGDSHWLAGYRFRASNAAFMNARPEQILYVARHMRKESRNDMHQLTWFQSVEAFALDRAGAAGPKWAITHGGLPVAVGGITLGLPGVATAWILATDDIVLVGGDLLRISRSLVARIMACPQLCRLQATVRTSWKDAMHFAERAGLTLEGVHPGTCSDGSATATFGIAKGESDA